MAEFVEHIACPSCGSSDANALYEDDSTHCFSCKKTTGANKGKHMVTKTKSVNRLLHYEGEFASLPNRHIDKATAKFYGVKVDSRGNYVYPFCNKDGEVIATKIRVGGEKDFRVSGNVDGAILFGQQLFGTSGKILTITEGRDDAMAAYKMGGSFPVVSVDSATSAVKEVKRQLDFIESYAKVKIAFDNDEPGRKAAQAVAELLSPGKAEIVTFTKYKDANEYLMNKDTQGYNTDFWNSKTYSTAGIVSFEDAFASVIERQGTEILPLPKSMPQLASMLAGGLAKGEITTVGALTSIGKTTFVNNLLYGFLEETESRVGYLGLETTVGELASGLIDLHCSKKVSDNDTLEESEKGFNDITWKDRLYIIDHQGSLELDEMIRRIRNTIIAFNLDVFFLDPLQQALPDLNNDTVKYAMDSLLKLAKQTNVAFVLVSHMRKPDGDKPHQVSEYDLLGSSAINQVSFNTILLSRDKMGLTDDVKSSTKIHLVKSRRTGQTGEAGWLSYNRTSGHLELGSDPYSDFGDDI